MPKLETAALIATSATFTKHQIDRLVPVEALIKCKMQDNLDFLQYTKRFWDANYPGGDYDPISRRKGSGPPPAAAGPRTTTSSTAAARRGTPTGGAAGARRVAPGAGAGPNNTALMNEIATQKETIEGLEKERDFYFAKLRDIELLLQTAVEQDPEIEKDEEGLVKHIQAILYSTEVS